VAAAREHRLVGYVLIREVPEKKKQYLLKEVSIGAGQRLEDLVRELIEKHRYSKKRGWIIPVRKGRRTR
jgi:hypothetical protein